MYNPYAIVFTAACFPILAVGVYIAFYARLREPVRLLVLITLIITWSIVVTVAKPYMLFTQHGYETRVIVAGNETRSIVEPRIVPTPYGGLVYLLNNIVILALALVLLARVFTYSVIYYSSIR